MKKKLTQTAGSQPQVTDAEEQQSQSPDFPIIAIGASAGGLEALEQFLTAAPTDADIAYVIIQHLDPNHKGMLPELLQRTTDMPVTQVTDLMYLRPNKIYIILPNKDMSILHGVLQLLQPKLTHGLHLPIDNFLGALAVDQRNQSIAVILSGMGSDGSIGLRAIKQHGGLVSAQEPSSAKFDGMPRSAIATNLVDIIASPSDLPKQIIQELETPQLHSQSGLPIKQEYTPSGLEKIIALLRVCSGNDFSLYKKNTLVRRIERRMKIHHIV